MTIFTLLLCRVMNTSFINSTEDKVEDVVLIMASLASLSLYIINFLLGLPLNIYALVLLFRAGGPDGSVSFSVNQCFAEILFTLLTPLYVVSHVHMTNVYFLHAVTFFTGSCMSARFLFQSSVCCERYLAVVHPITFLKYKSMKYRKIGLSMIWTYSFIWGIIMCNSLNPHYAVMGIMNLIALIVHIYLCFSILRVLRKPSPGERERKDGRANVAKKKAFQHVSFSLLLFLMQTVPFVVVFGTKDKLSPNAFFNGVTIAMDFYVAAGIMIPVLTLHQIDKLTVERCV